MIDRDLVLAKVETLERSLARIETARERTGLDVLDRQDIIVLNLQRGVQAMLDLAAHVVAREGLGVPEDLSASFALLDERAGILDAELADRMRRMTGFRNVAVHGCTGSSIRPSSIRSYATASAISAPSRRRSSSASGSDSARAGARERVATSGAISPALRPPR